MGSPTFGRTFTRTINIKTKTKALMKLSFPGTYSCSILKYIPNIRRQCANKKQISPNRKKWFPPILGCSSKYNMKSPIAQNKNAAIA